MADFKNINVKDYIPDSFGLKTKWMLISAQKDGKTNTMTASWGGYGVMWNKEVVFVVIRPQRYTKEFVDNTESFSLTFFDKKYLKDLSYLGTVSGREDNKISKVGFNILLEENVPYFKEAHSVIFAKKLFVQRLSETSFLDKNIIDKIYPNKDFHYLYIAEVTKILIKND